MKYLIYLVSLILLLPSIVNAAPPVAPQAGGSGDTVAADNETITGDWTFTGDITIGRILIETYTETTDDTITAAQCSGGVIYVTGAATLTLPAIVDGYSCTFITIGAVAVSIDPNASDLIMLDGTALAVGNKITNGSTAGDIATCTYYSADGWHCATNSWSDGGA